MIEVDVLDQMEGLYIRFTIETIGHEDCSRSNEKSSIVCLASD
jgi:hypothetical protein